MRGYRTIFLTTELAVIEWKYRSACRGETNWLEEQDCSLTYGNKDNDNDDDDDDDDAEGDDDHHHCRCRGRKGG